MAQTKFNTTQLPSEAETFFNGGTGTHTASDAHIASTANPHATTAAQVAAIPTDGWNAVTWSTPTRTSASVFTFAIDVTGIIQPGYKLKFTDTTTKYAVVKSVTYGAGVSTITIFINTDYTIVGNPSAISWSDIEAPFGWPDSFNFLPTYTGLTKGSGVTICKYAVKGKYIKFDLTFTMAADSTMGDASCTVPADSVAGYVTGNVWIQDAGTNTFLGLCLILGGTCYIRVIGAAGSYANVAALSTTVPMTWANTDFFAASVIYPW
jgi:hypothetical protein